MENSNIRRERRMIDRDKSIEILRKLHLGVVLKYVPSRIGMIIPDSKLRTTDIDFSKTQAYSPSGYGYIILNKQSNRLADYLIREMTKIRDPDTGEKIVNRVLRMGKINNLIGGLKSDLKGKTSRQTFTLYSSQIVALLLGIITGMINTRTLGPAGYGILSF